MTDKAPHMTDRFSTIELFAGAGGLAIGMSLAGFNHSVLIEWEANAIETLKRNRDAGLPCCKSWEMIYGDVRDYDFAKHKGEINFIAGGPPCQPFSFGGRHKGHADTRNMFPEAIRAVREVRPKAFIFENVKGLQRRDFLGYYGYIVNSLRFPDLLAKKNENWTDHLLRLESASSHEDSAELQYKVAFKLLNAADFGVPQVRERVIIVGIRSDQGIEYSFPGPTHSEDALLYDQWVSGEYWAVHKIAKRHRPEMPAYKRKRVEELRHSIRKPLLKPWVTVSDAIMDLPQIGPGQKKEMVPNHVYNPGARSYSGHTGSSWDRPAKALKAGSHGVPGGENMLRLDNGTVRYFTVRECARLQTFPDDWIFMGSWTECMRQLGNAVPVNLAVPIGTRLREYFDKKTK